MPGQMLLGRHNECAMLDQMLAAVRAGESQVLLLRGDAGVGKSALLEYLVGRASGCRVVRAAGVQSEMELAFAGLHQLCAPMLDRLERLPGPQRDALGTAFALSAGPAPEPFLVGLAVLSLLSEVAEEGPLVCVVDDAQWLDRASAQTLGFAGRRLLAESVALILAARDCGEELALKGLPVFRVKGLSDADAHALLGAGISGRLDARVRERIVAETRGNPLALLELPRGLTAVELAGGFGLPDALPIAGRIEESFQRRLEPLPVETRTLLLVAAAEPLGEPRLVWHAAGRLGVGVDAAAPAVAAELIEFGARVRFRHPLVRSAVYRAAPLTARQSAHGALAEATDPELDPDRRAWHRAQAATGPDEEIAAELERSAGRARARGGLAAAAAFLEKAAGLTPVMARRSDRTLAATQAMLLAGAPDAALALLAAAEVRPLDALQRARANLLRAQVAFAASRGSEAVMLLLQAAKALEPLDATIARETYLDALTAASFVGHLSQGAGMREVAEAARCAPGSPQSPRAADLLLDGLALLVTEGFAAGAPTLKRALRAFCSEPIARDGELRWLWLACRTAFNLWDFESWDILSARHVELAREAGALAELPMALHSRMGFLTFAGELGAAGALHEEVVAVSAATAIRLPPFGAVTLAAFRGREAEASALTQASIEEAERRGEGIGLTVINWANAVLYNGLARYREALAAAQQASAFTEELGASLWGSAELIEAAVRSGKPEVAAGGLLRLSESAHASRSDWALGIEANARALLSRDDEAESLYREAIQRLERGRLSAYLARSHLLYGEWLRRGRRRLDAREQLRAAHEMFTAMGMEAFAERARRELVATGASARKRTPETSGQLTAQEGQIARLARDGLSNPEIGARLFISPRTVEYHLHKVFAKLDISSRNELGRGLTRDAC